MITRKSKRVSYAELSSDDEQSAAKKPSISGRKSARELDGAAFRGSPVYSRLKRAKRSERPSFSCAKLFDLPTDVVLIILEQLEPPALWAISTGFKALQTLLATDGYQGVWKKSFASWKSYAARDFLVQIPHSQRHYRYDHVCGNLQYYGFYREVSGEENSVDKLNKLLEEMDDDDVQNYRRTWNLPFSPPTPHPEVSEYECAKFLFTETCHICQRDLSRSQNQRVLWEFARRLCHNCFLSRTESWTQLLKLKQQRASADKTGDLLDFTEFLCYEPYATGHHTGLEVLLHQRLLVFFEGDISTELANRLERFRERKRQLTGSEFVAWCDAKNVENELRRQWGRHLQEFVFIREMYNKHMRNRKEEEAVATKAWERRQRLRTLASKGDVGETDLALAHRWSPPFRKLFKHKHLLSKEAGRALQNQLFKYAKEIKDLMTENKHWVQNSVSDELASLYSQYSNYATYKTRATLPVLSPSDLWTLAPCRSFASNLSFNPDGEVRIYMLHSLFGYDAAMIMETARLRAFTIRNQLLDMLLDRETGPDHRMVSEVPDGDNFEAWVSVKLNSATSYFRCEICKYVCDWQAIVGHACAVKDLDYASYDALFINRRKTLCKAVGFKVARVTAPAVIPRLFELLSTAVSMVTKGREWRYKAFQIPDTFEKTKYRNHATWLFTCSQGACDSARCTSDEPSALRTAEYISTWYEMMLHLCARIENGSLKLEDVSPASVRVYAGISESWA